MAGSRSSKTPKGRFAVEAPEISPRRHKSDTVRGDSCYQHDSEEGPVNWKLIEREPSMEELLADEIMALMMRSAGIDAEGLRALLRRMACRRAYRGRTERTESMCCAAA